MTSAIPPIHAAPRYRTPSRQDAENFARRLEKYAPTDDSLGDHSRDRAALAALRRGLGKEPGGASEMFPHIVPLLPPDLAPWDEAPYYLVASLFALYPTPWLGEKGQSLGAAMRFMALDRAGERGGGEPVDEKGGGGAPLDRAVERRFVALLNADAEGGSFYTHLRHAVTLLKSRDRHIDWATLLFDLGIWGASTQVRQRWARDFWSPGQQSADSVLTDAGPTTNGDTPDTMDA